MWIHTLEFCSTRNRNRLLYRPRHGYISSIWWCLKEARLRGYLWHDCIPMAFCRRQINRNGKLIRDFTQLGVVGRGLTAKLHEELLGVLAGFWILIVGVVIDCVLLEGYCVNLVLDTGFLYGPEVPDFLQKEWYPLAVFYFSIFFSFEKCLLHLGPEIIPGKSESRCVLYKLTLQATTIIR